MPCLVTVSGYYGRRQGGYVSACVHLVVGGSVSRITQKLQWGFPLNLDGGGLVFWIKGRIQKCIIQCDIGLDFMTLKGIVGPWRNAHRLKKNLFMLGRPACQAANEINASLTS